MGTRITFKQFPICKGDKWIFGFHSGIYACILLYIVYCSLMSNDYCTITFQIRLVIPTVFANVINCWWMNLLIWHFTFYINQSTEIPHLKSKISKIKRVCWLDSLKHFERHDLWMNRIEIIENGKQKYIHQLHNNQNRKQPTIDILKFMQLNAERWTCRNLQCATNPAKNSPVLQPINVDCRNCWVIIWLKIKIKNLHPIPMIGTATCYLGLRPCTHGQI